jgi:segregation and condensation protein B
MSLKGKIEAIIYAAEEPITLEQIALLMKESVLQELAVERERAAEQATQEDGDGSALSEFEAEAPVPEDGTAADSPVDGEDDWPAPDGVAVEPAVTEAVLAEPVAAEQPASDEPAAEQPRAEASENAKPVVVPRKKKYDIPPEVKARVRDLIQELIADCLDSDRGIEVRQLAGGYRMATKPEHHDIVKAFAKSLKPPLRLSLPALETLAVVAYKQPVTAPEVGDIRGVDSQGVMATLLEKKLINTAGRKPVIGRPILYKTTKEFLLRFGMNDVSELPSMEEFEKLAQKEFFSAEEEAEGAAAATEGEAGPPDEDVDFDVTSGKPETGQAGSESAAPVDAEPAAVSEVAEPTPSTETTQE